MASKHVFILFLMMIFLYHPQVVLAYNPPDSSVISNDLQVMKMDSVVDLSDSLGSQAVHDFFLRRDSLDVYSYSLLKDDSINYVNYQYIDTINHTVGEFNPVKYFNVAYNDLGIIGSAQENQLFSPAVSSGFNVGFSSFNVYNIKPKEILLYKTRTPYSELFYMMGAAKEHVLRVIHAQSFVDDRVNANFDFRLYDHLGAYTHQHSSVKRFYGGLGYITKDSRYQAQAQYYYNNQKLEENGGIADLSDFEENKENNRLVYETNLTTAENLITKSGVVVQQTFNISKAEPDLSKIPDTNTLQFEGYSVTHFKKPYFDPVTHLGQIKYHFNYQVESFRYLDNDQKSKIYDGLPVYPGFDENYFFDSIANKKYINELTYSNSDYKDQVYDPKFLNYFFGIRHEYNEYYQDSSKRAFVHYALIGGVFVNISSNLSVLSDAYYYVGDYKNNDFAINGKLFFKFKSHLFTGGININHRSPDWIYQSFSSLRFKWDNDFGKTDIQKLFLEYHRKRFEFIIQVQNIKNQVYFDQNILPQQSDKNIQHILVRAQKDFRFGPLGIDISFIYQTISHSDIIRIPDITAKMKVFYQGILFNDALGLEIGVESRYYTAYYANRYMPAIRSFHLQNEQLIGDYPFLDVYLNAKIGKARLFVRYDHFNAGMMGYTYYASPDYPAQDAAFRFGVNWMLFN